MAKEPFFLLTISLFLALTTSKHRFNPNKRQENAYNGYSDSLQSPRQLKEENNNKNGAFLDNPDKTSPEIVTVRLQGDTDLGYYYVTLFFGTPVQKQTLIVDTGSVTTTIPCIACGDNCGKDHFNKPFDNTKSSSFKEIGCQESYGNWLCSDCTTKCYFRVGYVEGSSYQGNFNKDYVVFGNEIEDFLSGVNIKGQAGNSESSNSTEDMTKELIDQIIERRRMFMPFGCTSKETNLFYTQEADGILGLGISTNTISYPPNVLDALQIENPKASREFSLCLAPSGGYFTLGGHNTDHHHPDGTITYTKYHDEMGQYRVRLNKIEIEGKDLGLDVETLNKGEGAFFDSGTTLTHVPGTTYSAILDNLAEFCKKDKKHCGGTGASSKDLCWNWKGGEFATEEDFFDSFPTYKWYFGEKGEGEYDWMPEDYLYVREGQTYCMGISKFERETILGGTFMKNHDVLFDKANKRLGFVRANCSAVNGIITHSHSLPGYNIYILTITVVSGTILVCYFLSLVIKCFRKKRYTSMQNEPEMPSSRDMGLPSHINDDSAAANTDRSKDEGGITTRYQI